MDNFSKEQMICIARHLKAFHKNAENNEIADQTGPCRECELLGSDVCGNGNLLIDADSLLCKETGIGICWIHNLTSKEIAENKAKAASSG